MKIVGYLRKTGKRSLFVIIPRIIIDNYELEPDTKVKITLDEPNKGIYIYFLNEKEIKKSSEHSLIQ